MRLITTIIILLNFFWSCNNEFEKESFTASAEKTVEYKGLKNRNKEKVLKAVTETGTKHFDLSVIPKNWIQLTEINKKLAIYNSCDAGNLLITISSNSKNQSLLLHGQQENYDFSILNSYGLKDTVFIEAKWKDSNERQNFKFIWTDKENELANWITTFPSGSTSDNIFVTSGKKNNFTTINQPCKECWGEDCEEIETETQFTDDPIASIRKIFDDYTKFQESTDSQDNQLLMRTSLNSLTHLTKPKDLEIIINVWLYYDPTDFPSRDLVYKVLKKSRPESIAAVQNRIENKIEWERDGSAPYSELGYLKEILEQQQ